MSQDFKSTPIFVVSGSSALTFKSTNPPPDTCPFFATLERGSLFELNLPTKYTFALPNDTVYLSNGEVLV